MQTFGCIDRYCSYLRYRSCSSHNCLERTCGKRHAAMLTIWLHSLALWIVNHRTAMRKGPVSLTCAILAVCLLTLTEVSSTGQLPSPWSQHFHEGRIYYYNQQTGSMISCVWINYHALFFSDAVLPYYSFFCFVMQYLHLIDPLRYYNHS